MKTQTYERESVSEWLERLEQRLERRANYWEDKLNRLGARVIRDIALEIRNVRAEMQGRNGSG